MRILLTMNASLVTTLRGFVASGNLLFNLSQYHNWNTIGATATRDTVATLNQRMQRLLQTAPVERPFPNLVNRLQQVPNRNIIKFEDGAEYDGQVKEGGTFHGFGKYTCRNWTYIGEYVDGKRTGYGKLEFFKITTGCPPVEALKMYEGTHQDNKIQGYGNAIYRSGDEYLGELDCLKRQGYGKMVYVDGTHYEGLWKDGFRHGYGGFCWSRSSTYHGEWEKDKAQGYGNRVWTNGDVYEGEFHMHKRHGRGLIIYPQGEKYDGYWLKGKRNGYGKETKRSGEVVEAMWKDGEIERVLDD